MRWLGLTKGETFSLKDVKADLIILEYTNKYCFSCQLQAPVMNQLFEMVEKDEQLRGKVKFLAVAAGNNQNEVHSFKAEKKVPFPVVPDPKFLAYEAVGDPGATPFTLLLHKTDAGLLVARAKTGLTGTPTFMREMEESLRADWKVFAKPQKNISLEEEKRRKLFLGFNETQLMNRATSPTIALGARSTREFGVRRMSGSRGVSGPRSTPWGFAYEHREREPVGLGAEAVTVRTGAQHHVERPLGATPVGHLGHEPKVRRTRKGQAVTNFRIATTRRWKDAESDERMEATEWHRIVLFGKQAEIFVATAPSRAP